MGDIKLFKDYPFIHEIKNIYRFEKDFKNTVKTIIENFGNTKYSLIDSSEFILEDYDNSIEFLKFHRELIICEEEVDFKFHFSKINKRMEVEYLIIVYGS